MALAAAAALGLSHAALAVTEDDLRDLREQNKRLIEQYEKRLQEVETATSKAEAAANQAAVEATNRPTGENAFNPGISLILNGLYSSLSQDPSGFQISGFVPTRGEVGPPKRGLSLGESEITFAANIDPHFRGTLVASLSPDENAGVEEGYIQTLGLSNGLTIKAGRFFFAMGYQNEIHAHAWDFTDAPLANKVFLGNQLADDGMQFKWVAPTELYIDLGLDLGRGRKFPGGPDGGRDKNGFGSGNLFTHVGGDIGASTAWQVGLSHLRTFPQDRSYDAPGSTGTTVTNSFTGKSRLWALSGVIKWAPNGNSTYSNFKLQGEYFQRSEDGNLTYDTAAVSPGTQTGRFASRQSGWYMQGVYQFMPQWRIGYRYDRLNSGTASLADTLAADNFPILAAYNPTRSTLMVDWSGSEFSRIRLQFARDQSRLGATDNQVLLQYIMSLGAHGAHKF
jgi:hypothetical protein